MPSKREEKIHYILKQARRPICMVLVLAIVFIYGGLTVFAYPSGNYPTIAEYEGFTSLPECMCWPNMSTYYTNKGYDVTKLTNYDPETGGMLTSTTINSNYPGSVDSTFLDYYSNNFMSTSVIDNIEGLDYSDGALIVFMNPSNSEITVRRTSGLGEFCIVDKYIVSNQSFKYNGYSSNSSTFGPSYTVDRVASSGTFLGNYYRTAFTNTTYTLVYANVPVFFSSTDGSSGFTSSTFNWADRDNYFDFNFILENEIPNPQPESSYESQVAHNYLDFNCQPFYSGSDSRYVYLNLNMSWNENMIKHPEFYTVHVQPYVKLKLDSESLGEMYAYNGPVAIPYDYEEINLLDLRNTVGYLPSVLTKKYDLKRFISGQRNAYDVYGLGVQQWGGLFAWEEVEGDSNIDITKNGLLGTLAQLLSGSNTPTTYVKVRNDLSQYFDYYEIWARVWVTSDQEQYSSGVNESHYDFLTGSSYTDSTANNINNYPPDIGSGQLPSVISQSGQLPANTGSGSVNNGFSGVFNVVSNMNANIEYLYNLDASDFNNIAGNSTSALQSAINFVTSSDQDHGFAAILTRSYGLIPDEITDWIKATVGVLLGGAILGWVYNGVRIKRG